MGSLSKDLGDINPITLIGLLTVLISVDYKKVSTCHILKIINSYKNDSVKQSQDVFKPVEKIKPSSDLKHFFDSFNVVKGAKRDDY